MTTVAEKPTKEQTAQELLQEFLDASGFNIGLVMVSPNGSQIVLTDALDPKYTDWQPSVVVSNGQNK